MEPDPHEQPYARIRPAALGCAPTVAQVVRLMHEARRKLRVVGSALSPNGLGLSDEVMLNMAQCDAVLSVDAAKRQATRRATRQAASRSTEDV